MRSKGFTLIELLAVIVILAIIALIAVPIVVNIINDSKKSSQEESIKMYAKAIENAAGNYFLKHPNSKIVTVQNLKDENLINYDGSQVECKIEKIYKSGKIYLKDCTVGGTKVDYTYGEESYKDYIHLIEDTEPIGLSPGDKYTYDVNDNDTFYFYILSIEEDQVNLIMDRNICNDGKPADKDHQCNYIWYVNTNIYGPVTVIQELYSGTKEWDNVAIMEIKYFDEGNKNNNEYGYTSIISNHGVTTITGNSEDKLTIVGTNSKPLRARLPKYNEVFAENCRTNNGTCPIWLVNNLMYSNVSEYSGSGYKDKYIINKNNGLTNIKGYWLLSSSLNSNGLGVGAIISIGKIADNMSPNSTFGIRPVITVPISNF